MAATQCILGNGAPLGCGGTRDLHHCCAANTSAATAWCYQVDMDENVWGMFPAPCWVHARRIKAVLNSICKMYQIKWSVKVYLEKLNSTAGSPYWNWNIFNSLWHKQRQWGTLSSRGFSRGSLKINKIPIQWYNFECSFYVDTNAILKIKWLECLWDSHIHFMREGVPLNTQRCLGTLGTFTVKQNGCFHGNETASNPNTNEAAARWGEKTCFIK